MLLLGAGTGASYSGWLVHKHVRRPELNQLTNYTALLDELAETIIPATDTPGAKEAQVGTFIVRMVKECTSRPSQHNFLSGLHDVEDYARQHYGFDFIKCSASQKIAVLRFFESQDQLHEGLWGKMQQKISGDPFFLTLKKYTVLGYCTSMQGATKAMNYEPVPGRYIAALPLLPNQKAWSTQ
jgi:hypothetical protein